MIKGHYAAYIVRSNKIWYYIDDLEKQSIEKKFKDIVEEAKDKAYIFFYRKISKVVTPEVADLFSDTIGIGGTGDQVAVSLNVPTNTSTGWS